METLLEEKLPEVKIENKTTVQLNGRKTMLFPFHINDMLSFVKLHRSDRKGYLGQFCFKYMSEAEAVNYLHHLIAMNKIHIWTAYTKEIKSRFAGFVYLSDIEKFKCVIYGVMDSEFVKGLSRELRREKYTYSEDAFRALIRHVFTTSIIRIEADCHESNRLSFNLCKKVGFVFEGMRRKAGHMDGEFLNILYMSILKDEWKDIR